MAFLVPKITYGSGPTTLNFTYPPVSKPGADDLEAQRSDSITTSGLRQTVWWRTDVFKNLQMDYVPKADLPNWKAFIDYALTGGQFKYFPDSTLPDWTMYTLEDDKWAPKYSFGKGDEVIAKFTLRFRQVVPFDSGS